MNYICVPCTKHCNFEYYFVRVCGNTCIDLVHPSANGCLLCVVFVLVFFFFFQLKTLMKSLHLLVKKHNYQYLILALLILVACHRNGVSHDSTMQLIYCNTDFESYFISVTNFRLVCLLPIVAYTYVLALKISKS